MENFDEFMKKLISLPKKALTNTKRFLYVRKSLETKIQILEQIVRNCLNKMDEFTQTYNIIKRYSQELKEKNFIYRVKKIRSRKVADGKCYTTCLICNITCHKNCTITDNSQLMNCEVMKDGNCIKYQKKCRWDNHKNLPYRRAKKKVL